MRAGMVKSFSMAVFAITLQRWPGSYKEVIRISEKGVKIL